MKLSFIRKPPSAVPIAAAVSLAATALLLVPAATATAATPRVGLGTAESFAVLAGSRITNTGATTISGDLGVSPGTAITGFPPGLVNNGAIHSADAVALQAKSDLTTAYNDAAGRTPPTAVPVELGGRTLTAGVYKASTEMRLTGTVTLDAQSDPDAVFIFQAGSTLITGTSSRVNLIGGANPCNVFWQVGSSATLGTQTTFVGTVMALTSITLNNRATVAGRVLARNGQVAFDDNTITRPRCGTTTTTSPSSPATTTPAPTGAGPTSTGPAAPAGPPAVVIPVPIIPGLPGLPTAITVPPLPGLPGRPPTAPRPPNATPGTPTVPGVPQSPQQSGVPTTPQGESGDSAPGQISEVPQGAVDTGDGTLAPRRYSWTGLGVGTALLACAAAGAACLRRR